MHKKCIKMLLTTGTLRETAVKNGVFNAKRRVEVSEQLPAGF